MSEKYGSIFPNYLKKFIKLYKMIKILKVMCKNLNFKKESNIK